MAQGGRRDVRKGAGQAGAHPPTVARLLHPVAIRADDRRPAVGHVQPRPLQPAARPTRPRPRSLRHGEGQGAHHRTSGCAQAQARPALAHPLPLRPSGRRQDVARTIRGRGAGAQIRARLAGRPARRGRDPRPPTHLHRRHDGSHPAKPAKGGHVEPRLRARRGG